MMHSCGREAVLHVKVDGLLSSLSRTYRLRDAYPNACWVDWNARIAEWGAAKVY